MKFINIYRKQIYTDSKQLYNDDNILCIKADELFPESVRYTRT